MLTFTLSFIPILTLTFILILMLIFILIISLICYSKSSICCPLPPFACTVDAPMGKCSRAKIRQKQEKKQHRVPP